MDIDSLSACGRRMYKDVAMAVPKSDSLDVEIASKTKVHVYGFNKSLTITKLQIHKGTTWPCLAISGL